MTPTILLAVVLILLIALPRMISLIAPDLRAKPDHHHWLVRLSAAALGLAALLGAGFGTWRATRQALLVPEVSVLAPTQNPPPVPLSKKYQNIDIGRCKLIGTVLVVRMVEGRLLPLSGESLTCDWTPGSTADLSFAGTYGGATYSATMHLQEFFSFGNDGALHAKNCLTLETKGLSWSSKSGAGSLALDTLTTEPFGRGSNAITHAPLSLIPSAVGQDLRLLIHLTRADSADALLETPAAPWLESHHDELQRNQPPMNSYPGILADSHAPPGIRMLAFLGPAAFLLLLAAIAGAALFRRGRRQAAFTILLAPLVWYAGRLDSMVVQHRAAFLADASQPASQRALAMTDLLGGTFFHTGTARSLLRDFAAAPAQPESLRQLAASLAKE